MSPVPIGRWPVPSEARRIAVMGGTFDPVHRAHVELALAARDAVGAEWVVFIPAARNPLKTSEPLLSDRQRLELLTVALEGTAGAAISTMELEDGGASYTVETLRAIHVLAPQAELRLVIGSESARSFHRWREPREIIRLAAPAVLLRAPEASAEDMLTSMKPHWSAEELGRWRSWVVQAPLMPEAATDLRPLIAAGAWGDPALSGGLAPGVLSRLREWSQGAGGA